MPPTRSTTSARNCVGPTLIAYGTPEQQKRFLPKILDVTELWSQGYSEPGAGSDLANVSTTAELDGDHWVINGQKVWTSLAHWAQWCFVVARTEKGSKRHAGLSYLLVPLDQPGVEIRPIVQLTGDSEFNEVFFDDARTDADLVVGEPGDGWRVAMGTLTFERGVSTLGQQIRYARELSGIVDLAKKHRRRRRSADPRAADPVVGRAADHAVVCAGDHGRRTARPGQRVEVVVGQLASRTRRDRDGRPGQGGPDCSTAASSTNGSGCTCSRARTPSTAGPTRSSATSSPSGCSAYRERPRADELCPSRRRRSTATDC